MDTMRSRAALLPFPGDPFLFHYWLSFFNKYWADEIDTLYVHLNTTIEKEVVDYITDLCASNPKIKFHYRENQQEHGITLNDMLEECTEEFIMFIEDDCYIFKSGEIDKCFRYLESGEYDIVGSKRGSCSMEISARAKQIWGLDYEGMGDQGCNFWPNLFFTSKAKLLTTDRYFAAKSWKRGEEITALSSLDGKYCVQDEIANGDTFVWGSLQLQATTPQERIKYIPQYHTSPDDLLHYEQRYNLFDGVAPWCHIGSLSSGVGGILQDGHGRSLARRLLDPSVGDDVPVPNYCNSDGEKHEWERRIQFWKTFYDNREIGKLDAFAELYLAAIDRLIQQYGLSRKRIQARQDAYATVGL